MLHAARAVTSPQRNAFAQHEHSLRPTFTHTRINQAEYLFATPQLRDLMIAVVMTLYFTEIVLGSEPLCLFSLSSYEKGSQASLFIICILQEINNP